MGGAYDWQQVDDGDYPHASLMAAACPVSLAGVVGIRAKCSTDLWRLRF